MGDIQILTTSDMRHVMTKAGVMLSESSALKQISYVTDDGSVGGAIVAITINSSSAVTDLVIPYVYDPEEGKMVNAMASGYGYTSGTADLEHIYVNARYYIDYTEHPTAWYTLVRPSKISASYSVTDSSFLMSSMTVNCISRGELYNSDYSLNTDIYTHEMGFDKTNPTANRYYSSPSSQALSDDYWMHFVGASSLTDQGAFYTVAYSGYLNGNDISVDDQIFLPIYVA